MLTLAGVKTEAFQWRYTESKKMTDRDKLIKIKNFCKAREDYFKEFMDNSKDKAVDRARVSCFETVRFLIEDMLEENNAH